MPQNHNATTPLAATLLVALVSAMTATHAAQTAPAANLQPAASPAGRERAGYLARDAVDMLRVMPSAPQDGDARDVADRRIYRETRAWEGTPRWAMASADAELGSANLLRHFSCSLDIELTPQQAPKLVRILQRATADAGHDAGRAKDFFKRKRPFLIEAGATCRPPEEVAGSFDYPSGHATAGWAWALVLAQVAPERATPLLERGRAIGDSRVVCGVHHLSAVEGARALVGTAIALMAATPAYQSDLGEARAELAALRRQPHVRPEPARCETEAALVAAPIIPPAR
jgi:acid phosphatase (class A)